MVTVALAMGLAYLYPRTAPEKDALSLPPPEVSKPRMDVRAAIPTRPKAVVKAPEPKSLPKIAPPQVKEQSMAVANHRQAMNYWQHAARRFEQQGGMLAQETDPALRMNLIQSMSGNVRIDTLSTLDWAMTLEDPEERRAALDAINKNALVGIGARLHVDETGVPKIVETTVLSAVASTGMTEPGDYLSGMVRADGSIIYFKDRPVRDIVKLLHGQPGTEVQLLMERGSTEGDIEPYSFDVSVQRSMIIMQPPF